MKIKFQAAPGDRVGEFVADPFTGRIVIDDQDPHALQEAYQRFARIGDGDEEAIQAAPEASEPEAHAEGSDGNQTEHAAEAEEATHQVTDAEDHE